MKAVRGRRTPVTYLLVGLGGALGATLRYALNVWSGSVFGAGWPWGTMIANALGSFALGVVMELGVGRTIYGVDARIPLGVGVLGGFTTYSSFNLEVLKFWEQGQLGRAAGYASGTFVVCLAFGVAGLALARAVKSGG